MYFLDLIKLNNSWSKFYITPHILTETCHYIRKKYINYRNIKDLLEQIVPLIQAMNEFNSVSKNRILSAIELKNPIIEIGDISIRMVAEDFSSTDKKIAFLSVDEGLNGKYFKDTNVLAMNFRQNILNYIG